MGVGAVIDYFAFEAAEASADYPDVVAFCEGAGGESDGGVGVAEHEAESVELDGGYRRGWSWGVALFEGAVGQEAEDLGETDGLEAFGFGTVDKDGRGDYDAVDFGFSAVAPDPVFLLGGYVCVVAEFTQGFCGIFFGVVVDDSDEPFAVGYAYGVANALGHGRYGLV